jgi:hypothetical protein
VIQAIDSRKRAALTTDPVDTYYRPDPPYAGSGMTVAAVAGTCCRAFQYAQGVMLDTPLEPGRWVMLADEGQSLMNANLGKPFEDVAKACHAVYANSQVTPMPEGEALGWQAVARHLAFLVAAEAQVGNEELTQQEESWGPWAASRRVKE